MNAQQIISKLNLKPLPEEGGFYREVYRSGRIPGEVLPNHSGDRCFATHIYYLITPTDFSALHRVNSDEHFHHYAGDPVHMVQIEESGQLREVSLGRDLEGGQEPYVLVPRKVWQGTRLLQGFSKGWALLGCTVAPGFEFADFEVGSREALLRLFPEQSKLVTQFTRE